jgi:hypothetical protein
MRLMCEALRNGNVSLITETGRLERGTIPSVVKRGLVSEASWQAWHGLANVLKTALQYGLINL